jgi:penicillin-binding protein 1A
LNIPHLEAALVALDPKTGDVLAMVGGADYMGSTFNRAVKSKRQPGSAFKPFVYASALAAGYSPVSLLQGLTTVGAPEDPEWQPAVGDHVTEDSLTLRDALTASNNAAAAALQQQVGSAHVLQVASEAGLKDLPDVPSLALGSGEVTPLELTNAFAVFPNGGQLPALRPILRVADADDDEMFAQDESATPVVSPQVAFQMTTMLRDVVERGTGSGVRALGVRGPVAGKTGTTNDYRDAWFVGYSDKIVAGIWVGFDQPATIGRNAYAARVAVPIWAEFMKRALKVRPAEEFVVPPGIQRVALCTLSHQRPVEGCTTYTEYFKADDQIPTEKCSIHQGSLQERTAKAVSGFFKSLGGRLRGIFGRSR